MNYRQTLRLLSGRGNEVQGIHLGLHRIAAMMAAFGNPQTKYAVLHVAGTNGKGSVAAMSEAILRVAGWKTGLYTSPHLETIQERIRISGRNISCRKFAAVATRIAEAEKSLLANGHIDIPLTYFEFLTACAYLHFSGEEIDVALVEVGLGGRLDATNVVQPQACVITGISLDHQTLLGTTLAEIAAEKAGIIKRGVPVISGCRPAEARRVVRATARRLVAPLVEIDRDCRTRIVGERGPSFVIDLRTPHASYRNVRLALAGLYQARNAALAVSGVEALKGFPVSEGEVRRGLAHTQWPGRLDMHDSCRRTLLEGAHNVEGARALRNHLTRCEDNEIHMVFGALKDKDIRRMGWLLFPLARTIHLTPVANSRTADPNDIAAAHPRMRPRMHLHANAGAALHAAWDACPKRGLVVVTGSLYLLGEVLPIVRSVSTRRG